MKNPCKHRISRRALLGGALGAGACAVFPTFARAGVPVKATRIRLGDHGASTRFVLELSDKITWRTFALDGPARLVLDLPDVTFATNDPLPRLGVVTAIRTGTANPDLARVVFDLAAPALPDKDFLIEPRDGFGWRLVLDIVPVERSLFLANVGVIPDPVAPNTITPEPSTRLAGVPTPGQKPSPTRNLPDPPLSATNAVDPMAVPSITAPVPMGIAGSYGGPVMVRLANGQRVPVPLAKPQHLPSTFMPRPVIVLDPGHGGRDPGAIGASGTYEKTITLAMAQDVKAALEKTGRYQVRMTRDKDSSVKLRDRIEIGRKVGGDLFISIHADAMGDSSVRGVSIYTLSETASDTEAAALADRENKADILVNADLSNQTPDVATILIDLAQRATMNNSALFANTFINNLPSDVMRLSKPHRSADFAVLKAPDMPSVLLETGFLSNTGDETLLRDSTHRTRLAQIVLKTVDDYMAAQQQTAFQP